MNFRDLLLNNHSKYTSLQIANEIGTDSKKFKELMKLVLANEKLIAQRAAWPLSFSVESHPALLLPYLKKIINTLPFSNYHHAVRRIILRVLRFVTIPTNLKGKLINDCFELSVSQSETIAVRAFAIELIQINAKDYPEIIAELMEELTLQLTNASPGIKFKIKQLKLLL